MDPPVELPLTTVDLVNGAARLDGITFDARCFARALSDLGIRVRWYQCWDPTQELPDFPAMEVVRGTSMRPVRLGMGINRLLVFPRRLRHLSPEWLFVSDPTLLDVARAMDRTIVRLHDLRPLGPWADSWLTRRMYRHVLPKVRAARAVFVSTNAMGEELIPLGVDPSRIHLVSETHDQGSHPEHLSESVKRREEGGRLRALYVAADRPFKNIRLYLRLAHALRRRPAGSRFDFTLVTRANDSACRRILNDAGPDVEVLTNVPALGEIYRSHDVLVYPSLYEGFGRPLIEAMAHGLPLVLSNSPTLTEVVGDAGVRLSPDDPNAWVSALENLLEPSVFLDWSRRSLKRGEMYSVNRFTESVHRAFSRLASEPPTRNPGAPG